ncbi:MAG: signal peptide peptidase SppA [Dysgonamonadaceae bacterium]|jgi:protease-4|nr:signal peptide peptidase SppA [Dysgonamonadaceae bacterium]
MKSFFKMMFASTLGVIIASVILSIFSFVIFIGIAASLGSSPAYNLQEGSILKVSLEGIINERENENPFDFLFHDSSLKTYGLNDILSAIKKAKDNEKIKGIYLHAGYTISGYASMEPIRKALLDFKESGKFIIAYGEHFNHRSYYVASVAHEIFMNPQGGLDFRGLATSIQFNKGILEKWGVEMQAYKVGTYKSAVEPYIQDKMSDANREQVTAFLNDIWGNLLKGISESRGISVEQLNRYADECLIFARPQTVLDYRLIDGLKYGDEVETYLKEKLELKAGDKLKIAGVKDLKTVPGAKKKIGKDKIALLYADGDIVDDAVPAFYSESSITAKEYVKELNRLKEDETVKAVVFRVNSPGGSGYASEQIWHAVNELQKVKPIVVSMGDYAASGGYYIACGANRIIAEPSTLTGSIGVFGLIPNGAQLAKKMGATHDGVSTNKHANFADDVLSIPLLGIGLLPARPLNSEEGALIQAYVERFYDVFLSRVSEGRGKTKEEIDAIGQGRVWTGNQALELGLVDELGGIDLAVKAAAELAEIEDYSIGEYPEQKDFFQSLLEESTESVSERVSQTFMGKETFVQKRILNAWQNYDYRQAVMEVRVKN